MPDCNYDQWKDKKVEELATSQVAPISDQLAERHTIYSLALMTITLYYWNGNKYGRQVQYPLNEPTPAVNPLSLGNDYLGHNIAALIVDGDGLIIDFEFNHNNIFNSSVEHAESRLLRRVFSLAQIQDSWDTGRPFSNQQYATELGKVSLYTSLESCAQCSGIMTLAQLKEVIFLQRDPGQYFIGNILRNMTVGTGLQAPQPIPASAFRFPFFRALNDGYVKFRNRDQTIENAMVLDADGNVIPNQSYTTSITSFLCTKSSRDIYVDASLAFEGFSLLYPDWKPDTTDTRQLTNAGALAEAQRFVNYAVVEGMRGTPHK